MRFDEPLGGIDIDAASAGLAQEDIAFGKSLSHSAGTTPLLAATIAGHPFSRMAGYPAAPRRGLTAIPEQMMEHGAGGTGSPEGMVAPTPAPGNRCETAIA
ncbi:MAG TPA: hypothetical protein VF798_11680 [Burkholderiaceae bacterium]